MVCGKVRGMVRGKVRGMVCGKVRGAEAAALLRWGCIKFRESDQSSSVKGWQGWVGQDRFVQVA